MFKASKSTYSFVAWISSIIGGFCFVAWAFLPQKFLHSLGITYYPSRYYAVAIPSYIIVLYILSGWMYLGYNLWNTLDPADVRTIRDRNSRAKNSSTAPIGIIKIGTLEGIPAMQDIDPVQISTILKRKRS
jgi:phosphatidylinositol glycan class P protein